MIGYELCSYNKNSIRGAKPLQLYDLHSTNTERLMNRQASGNAAASNGKILHPTRLLGPVWVSSSACVDPKK